MSKLLRDQVPLTDGEICIVKGLLKHRKLLKINQQRIIAYFSFPHRTLHHNVVSAIACNEASTSDADYPPSDLAACRYFLKAWTGEWGEHRWAAEIAGARGTQREQLSFGYRFHPVGQGLFCSGHFTRPGQPTFRWVYDCGTDMGSRSPICAQHVRDEIAALKRDVGTDRLDLVTLSHFDEDHLSGMLDLLAEFRVGTLLLPYLTPWERLIVALSEGAAIGSDLLSFLTSPTAFLLARAEGRVERILLVPPSADGAALPPAIPPDTPVGDEDAGALPPIFIKEHKPEAEKVDDGVAADVGLTDTRVSVLQKGGYIVIRNAWEFVPYNDCRLEALATQSFKDAARPLAHQLTCAPKENERQAALEALTKLYDSTFKSSGSKRISARRRNEISLFLYAGPLGRVALRNASVTIPRCKMHTHVGEVPRFWVYTDRFGQLLTGDAFLHTSTQVEEFKRFYNPGGRLTRGAVFQVMHHGSEANWKAGVASLVRPIASLICSDPLGKHRHPGARVLSDFARFNPIQVDGVHGWQVEGFYLFA